MDKALSELIRISNAVGKDESLVQGGGGNTSVKTEDGDHMYIKASGTALKDMNGRRGWRRVRLDSVLSIINDKSITRLETHAREIEVVNRLLVACDDQVTAVARPSVEAHLHGYLDKCVIHLHPSSIGAYANAKNGKTAAALGPLHGSGLHARQEDRQAGRQLPKAVWQKAGHYGSGKARAFRCGWKC